MLLIYAESLLVRLDELNDLQDRVGELISELFIGYEGHKSKLVLLLLVAHDFVFPFTMASSFLFFLFNLATLLRNFELSLAFLIDFSSKLPFLKIDR